MFNHKLEQIKYDKLIEANKYIINKYEIFKDDNQCQNNIIMINDLKKEKNDLEDNKHISLDESL